jgi:hypothetical protein
VLALLLTSEPIAAQSLVNVFRLMKSGGCQDVLFPRLNLYDLSPALLPLILYSPSTLIMELDRTSF